VTAHMSLQKKLGSRRVSSFLAIVACSVTWACNAQPKAADMIPDHVHVATTRSTSVATRTAASGNAGREFLSGPSMSPEQLKSALDESIRGDHVFQSVTEIGSADEVLSVDVSGIDDHVVGFQVVVSLVAKWSLFLRGEQDAFWSEIVATKGTAPSPSVAPGDPVFRIALERAAKANIAQGLELVSRLPAVAAQSSRP
jgi:hypothetical protein